MRSRRWAVACTVARDGGTGSLRRERARPPRTPRARPQLRTRPARPSRSASSAPSRSRRARTSATAPCSPPRSSTQAGEGPKVEIVFCDSEAKPGQGHRLHHQVRPAGPGPGHHRRLLLRRDARGARHRQARQDPVRLRRCGLARRRQGRRLHRPRQVHLPHRPGQLDQPRRGHVPDHRHEAHQARASRSSASCTRTPPSPCRWSTSSNKCLVNPSAATGGKIPVDAGRHGRRHREAHPRRDRLLRPVQVPEGQGRAPSSSRSTRTQVGIQLGKQWATAQARLRARRHQRLGPVLGVLRHHARPSASSTARPASSAPRSRRRRSRSSTPSRASTTATRSTTASRPTTASTRCTRPRCAPRASRPTRS